MAAARHRNEPLAAQGNALAQIMSRMGLSPARDFVALAFNGE